MMTLENHIISKNIKAARIRAGFTQKEIARVLNINRATYQAIENNPIAYPFTKMEPIAAAFGCKVADFFML